MKNLLLNFAMAYHYRIAKYYDMKFRKHAEKHSILFAKKYPGMLVKQEGE